MSHITPLSWQCFRALCCKGPPPARPEYDLVCIGLTGSGKTSLLSKLCSESPENVVSTTGGYHEGCWPFLFLIPKVVSFLGLFEGSHPLLPVPSICGEMLQSVIF